MSFRTRLWLVVSLSISSAAAAVAFQTPDADALRAADAPPNAIFVDTLDMAPVAATVIRRGGRGGTGARAGAPATTPPPPPVYALGGVTYPHTVPMNSDRDLSIDLKGDATRFASMVGIDSAVAAGRGSVIFGVWVDGKKAADSGVMKGGDAPKLLAADLKGAKRL